MTSTSTIATLPSGQQAVIRLLENGDAHALHHYLQHLSELSKRRFGPHPFDEGTVRSICDNLENDDCIRLCCFVQDRCIAYALLQPGILPPDAERYLSYGFEVGKYKYATYAPSVAEDYHGQGIAQLMFDTLQKKAVGLGADYIVLWGGVQQGNPRARRFYEKNGFIKIGSFDLNGGDDDMLKLVR